MLREEAIQLRVRHLHGQEVEPEALKQALAIIQGVIPAKGQPTKEERRQASVLRAKLRRQMSAKERKEQDIVDQRKAARRLVRLEQLENARAFRKSLANVDPEVKAAQNFELVRRLWRASRDWREGANWILMQNLAVWTELWQQRRKRA